MDAVRSLVVLACDLVVETRGGGRPHWAVRSLDLGEHVGERSLETAQLLDLCQHRGRCALGVEVDQGYRLVAGTIRDILLAAGDAVRHQGLAALCPPFQVLLGEYQYSVGQVGPQSTKRDRDVMP